MRAKKIAVVYTLAEFVMMMEMVYELGYAAGKASRKQRKET